MRMSLSLGVVIPCHNNSWQLYAILKSLLFQTTKPDTLVIVDDNSTLKESAAIRELCKKFIAEYIVLPKPSSALEELGRRALARTVGTLSISGDIVLYLDGDMLLAPTYVENVKRYFELDKRIYVRGERTSIPKYIHSKGVEYCMKAIQADVIPFKETLIRYVSKPAGFRNKEIYPGVYQDRWYWTASNNLAVLKRYAVAVGLWDQKFLGWGEEDIDFSYRLYKSGLTPLSIENSEMRAYHLDHEVDWKTNISTLTRNARYLLQKHPEVREFRRQAYNNYDIDIKALSL